MSHTTARRDSLHLMDAVARSHTHTQHHFPPLSLLTARSVRTHHLFTAMIVSALAEDVLPWKLATTDGFGTSRVASAIAHVRTRARAHSHAPCSFNIFQIPEGHCVLLLQYVQKGLMQRSGRILYYFQKAGKFTMTTNGIFFNNITIKCVCILKMR